MLKKRDLHESPQLFELMVHPDVFPYVRHKAHSSDEHYFLTKQTMEAEEQGELISRTILDEWNQPIGTINLFDVQDNYGFLATWLGKDYHGKGYNQLAKEAFFEELFFQYDIHVVFMKIRRTNIRSQKAAEKMPFCQLSDEIYPEVLEWINKEQDVFHLYAVTKDQYLFHYYRTEEDEQAQEA
ncbi:GNAT family N-acetyltransferase [Pontibacillus salicampi]|uniref:GNAT family N-acetyltransferase n=1 Tax=Pontibacillus salicampi TaxID=1449801 RepID=A0ABV6LI24_9BACI